ARAALQRPGNAHVESGLIAEAFNRFREVEAMTKRRLFGLVGMVVAPVVGLAALGVALFLYFHTPRQRTYTLTITAGQQQSTRHTLLLALQEAGAGLAIQLKFQEMAGSEEALDRVNAGELDLALVAGGLHVQGRAHVRQVATLTIEPLHLPVKEEVAAAAPAHPSPPEGQN